MAMDPDVACTAELTAFQTNLMVRHALRAQGDSNCFEPPPMARSSITPNDGARSGATASIAASAAPPSSMSTKYSLYTASREAGVSRSTAAAVALSASRTASCQCLRATLLAASRSPPSSRARHVDGGGPPRFSASRLAAAAVRGASCIGENARARQIVRQRLSPAHCAPARSAPARRRDSRREVPA